LMYAVMFARVLVFLVGHSFSFSVDCLSTLKSVYESLADSSTQLEVGRVALVFTFEAALEAFFLSFFSFCFCFFCMIAGVAMNHFTTGEMIGYASIQ